MSILKFQITNPEAIVLIGKIKSGEIFHPIRTWFKEKKWYLFSGFIVLVLITALIIGKQLSEKTPVVQFLPPEIETPLPTTDKTIQSTFSSLKQNIQNFNTDLPDPYIPTFDNQINLEAPAF